MPQDMGTEYEVTNPDGTKQKYVRAGKADDSITVKFEADGLVDGNKTYMVSGKVECNWTESAPEATYKDQKLEWNPGKATLGKGISSRGYEVNFIFNFEDIEIEEYTPATPEGKTVRTVDPLSDEGRGLLELFAEDIQRAIVGEVESKMEIDDSGPEREDFPGRYGER
jgi:hypothetical protein